MQSTQAVAFTTGSNSGGYILKNAHRAAEGAERELEPSSPMTATLHAMAGTGQYSSTSQVATTVLATLAGTTPTGSTYADTTFTCAGSGCKLSSGSTYFVVLASSAHPGYDWARATTETEVALPSGNGWSIGFGHYKQTAALDWGSVSTFNIAELVFANAPTLTSSSVTATTATLTIANHAGDWYYKHTNTGATCDGPVSGTSKNLTGLTAGTSYTYSAYSDSSCATLLATAAQFTTLIDKVSVSNLDETLTTLIVTLGPNAAFAQEFTTGNTTGAYQLTKVTVDFSTVITASAVTVAIHDRQSDGTPSATARATLSGTPATGQAEFTCSGNGCDLDANTSYFVHVSASAANAAYPSSAASNDQTLVPTGTGWSIADARALGSRGNRLGRVEFRPIAADQGGGECGGQADLLQRRRHDGHADHRRARRSVVVQSQHRTGRDLSGSGGGGHVREGPDRPHGGHLLHLLGLQRQHVHHGQLAGHGVGVHDARLGEHPEWG